MLAEARAAAPRAPRSQGLVEVRIRFPSDPLAVRSALGSVLQGLSHLDLSDDLRGTLELVLAEALNNVVEHAHGGAGAGAIEVRVAHCASRDAAPVILCELIDDGAPMPEGALPHPPRPEIAVPSLEQPEGGWGWFLIHELARDIGYERRGGRNRLRFALEAAPETCAG